MNTIRYWISLIVLTYSFNKLSDVSGELYFICLTIITAIYMATGSYRENVISFKMPFGKSKGNAKGTGEL